MVEVWVAISKNERRLRVYDVPSKESARADLKMLTDAGLFCQARLTFHEVTDERDNTTDAVST